ncbi:zeta toxin protein [Mycolicibacterium fortuitum]|uniref:zeta toxin family protein n=1 Tax=Mycolicibacterium fortuitum TaxID=1766 RepID=UPI0007EC11A9|nr:zeta toxin family protein [Mycolicibacterium fortuitum]OBG21522.1 zeta toxin protein [Mycolicibacterium fortuitum]
MNDHDNLRTQVAEQLTARSAAGGPLHRDAPGRTERRYATSTRRRFFHRDVMEHHLAQGNPRRDGLSVIISAGPPGAGKTTILRSRVHDLADYRVIDADAIKDDLIEQALEDGIYDDLLTEVLADGYTLAPRELAALVHNESVQLADQLRKICIARNENIVIEGTLTWQPHGQHLYRELADARYETIEVYGVEIEQAQAHQQALSRWWEGRLAWVNGTGHLGGRFTPAEAIDICYPATGRCICITNALQLIDTAQSGDIPNVHVMILSRQPTGALEITEERFYRQ